MNTNTALQLQLALNDLDFDAQELNAMSDSRMSGIVAERAEELKAYADDAAAANRLLGEFRRTVLEGAEQDPDWRNRYLRIADAAKDISRGQSMWQTGWKG